MIKYLVKLDRVATENNIGFLGEHHRYWYGKRNTIIDHTINDEIPDLDKDYVRRYGYDNPAAAKRSDVFKHGNEPEDYRWNTKRRLLK